MTELFYTLPKNRITSSRSVFRVALFAAWIPCLACLGAPPVAPTNLVATAPVLGELNLTWEDNATDEEYYSVQVRIPPATAWGTVTNRAPNSTSAFLTGGSPATTYEFRVLAFLGVESSSSNVASVTTPDAITSSPYAHISIGQPFSFFVTATNGSNSADVTYSASPLPAGLSIDPDSGEISGTPTSDGYTAVTVVASYASPASPSANAELALRIPPALSAPILENALPTAPLIAQGANSIISLNSHFTDPDTSIAVSIDTTEGSMVFSLFDRAMPEPVANFLSYVDANSYTNNVFHRSVNAASFDIIQSGGFFGDATGLASVSTTAPIINAPGIPNNRGTLAFARTTDPDSATSGWYINAQDSPGLDSGDSYAVFGRATAASLTNIDTIFNFTTGTYSVPVNGNPISFAGFPTTDGSAPNASPSNLIKVTQIVRVPALTYTLTSNSMPTIASAVIVDAATDPKLQITPLQPGETTIQFTVTDIDGNEITGTHHVTVEGSYTSWLAGLTTPPNPAGPNDNPAGGSFNNLQSYAFGGNPSVASDDQSRGPEPAITNNPYDVSFYHRKFASDLVYTVQYSTDLDQWNPIWTSADGIMATSVVDAESDGDFWKLTVRKTFPQSVSPIFFRVVVTLVE